MEKLKCPKEAFRNTDRVKCNNILNYTMDLTGFLTAGVEDTYTDFELIFPSNVKTLISNYTNVEGKRAYLENWKDLIIGNLDACIGDFF